MTLEELQKLKKEETKKYYLSKLKEFGVKIIIFIIAMIVLAISLSSSMKDMSNIFGNK